MIENVTNKIAQRIDNYINANLRADCSICKSKCLGWSWSIYYIGNGSWGLFLYHHLKEVGYARTEGNVDDILLTGLEVMIRERWGEIK